MNDPLKNRQAVLAARGLGKTFTQGKYSVKVLGNEIGRAHV